MLFERGIIRLLEFIQVVAVSLVEVGKSSWF